MYILDLLTQTLIDVEIVRGTSKDMPLKKDGWSFPWKSAIKQKDTEIYILRLKSNPSSIQGVLQLKKYQGMLIMDSVEIAPQNIGRKNKRYDYVAGCLIAFACRESFKLESNYKGFLSFESKNNLINWYQEKYYAVIAMHRKMYIEPENGQKLIDEYLERTKK